MKKQVSILLGLCSGTKYLLCDETFDGLDPVAVSYTHLDVYKRQVFLPEPAAIVISYVHTVLIRIISEVNAYSVTVAYSCICICLLYTSLLFGEVRQASFDSPAQTVRRQVMSIH